MTSSFPLLKSPGIGKKAPQIPQAADPSRQGPGARISGERESSGPTKGVAGAGTGVAGDGKGDGNKRRSRSRDREKKM